LSWGLVHWGMLAGLAGVAIPVVIHLLNRRRTPVVDWGAMQFLELGRRARLKFRLSELVLLAARIALLALVALAVARPFWIASAAQAKAGESNSGIFDGQRRDVVIVIDGSGSMGRKIGPATPIEQAVQWAQGFVSKLGTGDSVAVLMARDRVVPLVVPASFDLQKVEGALAAVPPARGTSELAMAIAEALRLLEPPGNPGRDIIVLTDGQRFPWRPDQTARWAVPREMLQNLERRGGSPRIWAVLFDTKGAAAATNGSVAPLELSGGLITPNRPITVTTRVGCTGPGELTRSVELLVDGEPVPGMSQSVGPIPPGGEQPVSFKTSISQPGSHALTVRLTGVDDELPFDDESSRAIEVTAALPVLLVDGEPGLEPLSSETDFMRAALAPGGAEAVPISARVVRADAFIPSDLKGRQVAVLANVERLSPEQNTAINRFVESGGGVMVALGDKVDASFANAALYRGGAGWLPARLGEVRGDSQRRQTMAHPSPRTFLGPALTPLGQGESPPLAGADLFTYRVIEPAKNAAVTARLDTGEPWIVERPFGRGRVAIVAGPIDAEGGTLPVNPDFVPWAHELVYYLAGAASSAQSARPGEPILLELDRALPAGVQNLPVTTPSGAQIQAAVVRSEGKVHARLDETTEPGIYRLHLPDQPGGSVYATVDADGRESDLRSLERSEATDLARGWPLHFESEPERLTGRLFAAGAGSRHEIWRYLVLGTLAGLCMEVWLTRRMVKNSGMADVSTTEPSHPEGGRAG
jgi:von Willebrand factor type A domain/Aerotolerance regulator N-terminal